VRIWNVIQLNPQILEHNMKTVLAALALTIALPAASYAAGQAQTGQKDCCAKTADGKSSPCCEKKADGGKMGCCEKHATTQGAADPHAGHNMNAADDQHAGHSTPHHQ